jgi:periplasmic protein TonB
MHTCAIAIAVFATEQVVRAAAPPENEHIDFVAPPPPPPAPPTIAPREVMPAAPVPLGHLVVIAPIDIPSVLPAIDLTRPITDERNYVGGGASGGRSDGDSGAARSHGGDVTYFAAQVEKPAVQIAGTGIPDYPDMLRAAGIEGEVRAQFVVDTTGRAELGTLKFVKSGHAQFNEAVRKALAKMRFKPAETASHRVRQIVEMPFVFSIR